MLTAYLLKKKKAFKTSLDKKGLNQVLGSRVSWPCLSVLTMVGYYFSLTGSSACYRKTFKRVSYWLEFNADLFATKESRMIPGFLEKDNDPEGPAHPSAQPIPKTFPRAIKREIRIVVYLKVGLLLKNRVVLYALEITKGIIGIRN